MKNIKNKTLKYFGLIKNFFIPTEVDPHRDWVTFLLLFLFLNIGVVGFSIHFFFFADYLAGSNIAGQRIAPVIDRERLEEVVDRLNTQEEVLRSVLGEEFVIADLKQAEEFVTEDVLEDDSIENSVDSDE